MNQFSHRVYGRRAGNCGVPNPAPLRVMHLVSSLRMGGMEQFAVRLASAQRNAGIDARLLAFHSGPLEAVARDAEVPVSLVTARSTPMRLAKSLLTGCAVRPGIIHAHNVTTLHYGALLRRALGARLVLTHHGSALGQGRAVAEWEWNALHAVVGVSDAVLQELPRERLAGRIGVIHNGVTAAGAASRSQARGELGLGDQLTGIIVARIDGNKGHDVLLAALAALRSSGKSPAFLIVGDGAERAAMEARAAALQLPSEQVRFLGTRSDVDRLLSAADFFVLPSRAEGLPLSLLEAMSRGLPAVSTRVGGVPEVITEGRDGLLVPADSPKELALALEALLEDPVLRATLGGNALRTVDQRFSFPVMLERYRDLYLSLDPARSRLKALA